MDTVNMKKGSQALNSINISIIPFANENVSYFKFDFSFFFHFIEKPPLQPVEKCQSHFNKNVIKNFSVPELIYFFSKFLL